MSNYGIFWSHFMKYKILLRKAWVNTRSCDPRAFRITKKLLNWIRSDGWTMCFYWESPKVILAGSHFRVRLTAVGPTANLERSHCANYTNSAKDHRSARSFKVFPPGDHRITGHTVRRHLKKDRQRATTARNSSQEQATDWFAETTQTCNFFSQWWSFIQRPESNSTRKNWRHYSVVWESLQSPFSLIRPLTQSKKHRTSAAVIERWTNHSAEFYEIHLFTLSSLLQRY